MVPCISCISLFLQSLGYVHREDWVCRTDSIYPSMGKGKKNGCLRHFKAFRSVYTEIGFQEFLKDAGPQSQIFYRERMNIRSMPSPSRYMWQRLFIVSHYRISLHNFRTVPPCHSILSRQMDS